MDPFYWAVVIIAVVIIAFWLVTAAKAAKIASAKHRSAAGFFCLALLIGPLGVAAARHTPPGAPTPPPGPGRRA
jgi:threonine/homoserine efflux transporter RhtA